MLNCLIPSRISKLRFSLIYLLTLCISSIVSGKLLAQSGEITLDHVEGRVGLSDTLSCGRPVEFAIRVNNTTSSYILGLVNYFIVYSPENASWSPPTTRWNPILYQNYFDGGTDGLWINRDGMGVDTLGFGAFALFEQGVPPSFSAEAFYIITSFNCSQQGMAICIDSVTEWLWSTSGGEAHPTWDGPHCFVIGPCCVGQRGDFNLDGAEANILDLTFLVDYLFRGSQNRGACPAESDVNADNGVANVLDLTFMVDYLFRGGPIPTLCS